MSSICNIVYVAWLRSTVIIPFDTPAPSHLFSFIIIYPRETKTSLKTFRFWRHRRYQYHFIGTRRTIVIVRNSINYRRSIELCKIIYTRYNQFSWVSYLNKFGTEVINDRYLTIVSMVWVFETKRIDMVPLFSHSKFTRLLIFSVFFYGSCIISELFTTDNKTNI